MLSLHAFAMAAHWINFRNNRFGLQTGKNLRDDSSIQHWELKPIYFILGGVYPGRDSIHNP